MCTPPKLTPGAVTLAERVFGTDEGLGGPLKGGPPYGLSVLRTGDSREIGLCLLLSLSLCHVTRSKTQFVAGWRLAGSETTEGTTESR